MAVLKRRKEFFEKKIPVVCKMLAEFAKFC